MHSANKLIDVIEEKSFEKCLTPNILDITRNGHLLPEETKSELKSFGFDFSEILIILSRPVLNYSYESEHFQVHMIY